MADPGMQNSGAAVAQGGNAAILVVGELPGGERESIRFAANRASAETAFCADIGEAQEQLSEALDVPTCVLIDKRVGLEAFAAWVRDRARFFTMPIVALVPHPSDAEFRAAYAAGADDTLVKGDLGGITRRLANLANRPMNARPPANQGLALIGFPDLPRRRVLGRSLRQAGFEVLFAADSSELVRLVVARPKPTLVVVNPTFPPDGGRQVIADVRKLVGAKLPALILPAGDDEVVSQEENTDSAQAGKLLFFAEEALRADVRDQRASRRVLHHGLCAFREAGSFYPIYGLTHNISRQGLYVRTLDPPRPGCTLWFEMRAPHEGSAIHLRGQVVWRREPSQMGGAAPPGFGMRIEACACAQQDLELYERGYDALCQQDSGDLDLAATVNT
ncbi:MAG: PilZ domain-containing protein [Myxococcales bacterium]|nr:PilZ domain-containing protein [Myxococcales bacterium]